MLTLGQTSKASTASYEPSAKSKGECNEINRKTTRGAHRSLGQCRLSAFDGSFNRRDGLSWRDGEVPEDVGLRGHRHRWCQRPVLQRLGLPWLEAGREGRSETHQDQGAVDAVQRH